MAISRISGNQISTSTEAIISTLTFLNTNSVFRLPVGTEAQRPTGVSVGTIRFNTTLDAAEVYVADVDGQGNPGWTPVGSGGPSLGGDSVIRCAPATITETAVIGATTGDEYMRGLTIGPVTVANGVSITVESNAIWKVI